ncbi:hypothetical protein MSG28_001292 [Choristoneura fumiferana]|uniref:Uncharacterized protein n=1 Tax=Choristoneura fumiferana TaxID=7141 RepID=A0ACC0K4G6_CHOFU|nr:hypothetical protein MSG28_001292 [Choristoneura fumiferana]
MPEYSGTDGLVEKLGRRNAVPVVYLKGSHYDIGFDTGRLFASVIKNFLVTYENLPDFEKEYATETGRGAYDKTLANMKNRYPQYVKEIQGIADGANVPFYKLFLLHLDDIIGTINDPKLPRADAGGCSSIGINTPDASVLGHNEDAFSATLNHWYIVSAHVIPSPEEIQYGAVEERFASLCYAGQLPGYTMGHNENGLVFSINTLSALHLKPGGTPRTFITRALLAAKSFAEAEKILRDEGLGAANGFSINMIWSDAWGARQLYNVEVAPEKTDKSARSALNVHKYDKDSLVHCNIYQRLNVTEVIGPIIDSSVARLSAINHHKPPTNRRDVAAILSDTSGKTFTVWQGRPDTIIKTITTGIFDLDKRSWSIYIDQANNSEPVAVLPLRFTQLNELF